MKNIHISLFPILCFSCLFYGCHDKRSQHEEISKKVALIHGANSDLPPHFSMDALRDKIDNGELRAASQYINVALQSSVKSSTLHILNGLVYETMAQNGYDSSPELAGVAYQAAKTADPSNWVGSYLLGMHEIRVGRYHDAQKNLYDAFCLRSNDPEILYALAYASYYVGDLPAATAAIRQSLKLSSEDAKKVRAAALIYAACNKPQEAGNYVKKYRNLVPKEYSDVDQLQKRVSDWGTFHNHASIRPVQGDDDEEGPESLDSQEDVHEQEQSIQEPQMETQERPQARPPHDFPPPQERRPSPEEECSIGVDFCTLHVSEEEMTQKGNNILEKLAVTLGGTNPLVALTRTITSANEEITKGWTQAFNFAITPVVMAYNLNIANVQKRRIEVIDRPSVFTVLGKTASFYSGRNYIGTSSGSSGSGIIDMDTGSKVEITPLEIDGDYVTIEIMVTGSRFIEEPNMNIGINDQMIAITRANVSNTVRAKFGQTMVIGGLNSTWRATSKKKVPLLGDIPFLQYFFAEESTLQDRRSVLFLMTPRRGTDQSVFAKKKSLSSIGKKLQGHGLLSLGEYSNLYYIMKYVGSSDLFMNFRSGDLYKPFYGNTTSLKERFDQMRAFLYF